MTGDAHIPFLSCLSGLAAQWRQLDFHEIPEGAMRKGTEANIVQHLSSEDTSNTLSTLHHRGCSGLGQAKGKSLPQHEAAPVPCPPGPKGCPVH